MGGVLVAGGGAKVFLSTALTPPNANIGGHSFRAVPHLHPYEAGRGFSTILATLKGIKRSRKKSLSIESVIIPDPSATLLREINTYK